MASSLITFDASANAVTTTKKSGTTVRLMTAKEYKHAKGLKGQAGRRAYNAYLLEQGKANTAGLAAALTSGELLIKSWRNGKNAGTIGYVKRSSIVPAAEEAKTFASTLSDKELLAIIEARKVAPAAPAGEQAPIEV